MVGTRWQRANEAVRGEVRHRLDARRGHPTLAAGVVSIEFDDGYRSAHHHALPRLEDRGWRSTHYLVSGEPDPSMEARRSELVDDDERVDLAARADIGSHTVTHRRLDLLPREEASAELVRSRATLEAAIGRPVDLLAAPFGHTSDAVQAQARRTYRAQRVIGGAVNVAHGFDPWAIRGLMPRRSTTDDEFLDILRRTHHRRGWAVLVWHRIGEGSDSPWDIPVDHFARQLDLIAASGLEVASTTAVVDRLTHPNP